MSFELRLLCAVVFFLLFHFGYQAYLRKRSGTVYIKDYDEYVCEHLVVTIHYNCQEQEVLANMEDYDTSSTIYMTIFSIKDCGSDQEKELEGIGNDVGRAVIRCLPGTNTVYQWWYLD